MATWQAQTAFDFFRESAFIDATTEEKSPTNEMKILQIFSSRRVYAFIFPMMTKEKFHENPTRSPTGKFFYSHRHLEFLWALSKNVLLKFTSRMKTTSDDESGSICTTLQFHFICVLCWADNSISVSAFVHRTKYLFFQLSKTIRRSTPTISTIASRSTLKARMKVMLKDLRKVSFSLLITLPTFSLLFSLSNSRAVLMCEARWC